MTLFFKNLLFTLVIPGTVAVYVPLRLAPPGWPAFGMVQLLATLLLAVGGAIYLWCVWDFATFGRGTPAPIDAPKRLVVRGLYRHVRNPMYVAVLTVVTGWTVYFTSPRLLGYEAMLFLLFNSFVSVYEEPTLRRLFGDEYERYCARVGRWLPRRG